MKYNIQANQKMLHELTPELDIFHYVILDYLKDICISRAKGVIKSRLKDDTGDWTWIDYSHLLNELPCLKLKSKGAITTKLTALVKAGYIESKKGQKYRVYVRLTEKMDMLAFSKMNTDNVAFTSMNSKRSPERTLRVHDNNNNINNNHNTKNQDSRDKALDKKQEEKFDFDAYIKTMSEDKSRHVQLIGRYLKRKGFAYDTKEKVQMAMKRHLRAARDLSAFSNKEIRQAVEICEEKYQDIDWTMETVLKVLTSNNLQTKNDFEKKYKNIKV